MVQAPQCASRASHRSAAHFETRQLPLGLLLRPLPLLHLFLLPLCVLCDLCGRFWAPFTIHNIASEWALGIIALLRKNALFVGHKEGGAQDPLRDLSAPGREPGGLACRCPGANLGAGSVHG